MWAWCGWLFFWAQSLRGLAHAGVVLARDGGALARMLPVFNIFFGGPLGTGQQWFSWIHRCAAQASSYS